MRKTVAAALLLGLSGCASVADDAPPAPAWARAFAPAPAAQPRTGIALPIGKCVNLANMLEPPTEAGWGGRPFRDEDAPRIRAEGFSTVRLPVGFSLHAGTQPPYAIDPAFMARVRHVVETNLAAGLNVIIDMHNYDALFADPAANRDRLAGLWRQVAAEFRNAPDNLWFELINEPHGALDDSNLWETLGPALAAVRESNPTRPVIVGGQNWSGIDSLATLALPDDPNVVPTFHYYDPFDFTHQGATWVSPVPPVGRAFGTATDEAQLRAALGKVQAFIARTGRVPFMGEYGAYDRIPLDQRAAYYRTVSAAFASIGIQSCAWGYTNTFHLWRDGTGWLRPIVEGLRTTTAG
jgi:aryl-phospho-beta-D-glucosidase BglC (GH1 family)